MTPTAHDLASLSPELILTLAGVVVLMLEGFAPSLRRTFTGLAALGTLLAAWSIRWVPAGTAFNDLIEATPITSAFSLVVLLATLLGLLASQGYLRREGILNGEYHALLLWCAAGLLLMLRATELLTVFLALELLSLCLYTLAAYHRRVIVGTEAAIKYFLMGAFASAFVLYGIALVYGATGSTRLEAVADLFARGEVQGLAGLGVLLLITGFTFKMSVVPFHAWSPDTYQGAPSPFVAFLSVAPKAASAVVLIRVLQSAAGLADFAAGDLVALLAALSMLVGNFFALVQKDIKRMLAYSGIAHMGYLLIALVHLDSQSWTPVFVYLVAYTLMNAGAFAVVTLLYPRPSEQHLISDLGGWGYRYPLLGLCLTVCMLSLAGLPPTAGFIGKYLVFQHALARGDLWLVLLGVATTLVGAFYYLRVVYVLYMKDEVRAPEGLLVDVWGRAAALVAAAATLVLGVWPGGLVSWMVEAVRGLY